MRIRTFLTGAGGYVGLHILRELLGAGHLVTAVVRSQRKLGPLSPHANLRVVEADLEDHAQISHALSGHDVLIHAALLWGDDPGSELQVRDVAVAAKLFDSSALAGLRRCIYLSSAAVHRPFRAEMSEADGLSATDMYGATKGAGELFLRAACAAHSMTGVVVRPGPVIGAPAFAGGAFRTDDRIAQMVAAAMENRPIVVPREHGRQFSDVCAVAQVIRVLTTLEAPLPAYICLDREVIAWESIAQLIVDTLGSASEVRVQPDAAPGAAPRFLTERIERLNGGPIPSQAALLAHIRHLAQIPANAAGRFAETPDV
jgi:nucleoside-diphosphate-sugar epimerase